MFRVCKIIVVLCVFSRPAIAQDEESTWSLSLDSIVVKGARHRLPIKSAVPGMITWDISKIGELPQLLGNVDPIRYAQMLPGVQTNGEFRGGINIGGSDNQHNVVTLSGVPVFYANHLLGIFSAFNASHFKTMSLVKGIKDGSSLNRLGGQLDMIPQNEVADSVSGSLSVGLISSQATISLPLGQRTSLTLSGRAAYMNLLYSRWLKSDDGQLAYSFADANATIVHQLGEQNKLVADFYYSGDDTSFNEQYYFASMRAKWRNLLGALHWWYDNAASGLSAKASLYVTSYDNRFTLDMEDMSFALFSGITDVGVKSEVFWKSFTGGVETTWHKVRPQAMEQSSSTNISDGHTAPVHALETSLYGNYRHCLGRKFFMEAGLRGIWYNTRYVTDWRLTPLLSLAYDDGTQQARATYALRHQFLFQTGFSDLGLPTEFWLAANQTNRPQQAHELTLDYTRSFFRKSFVVSLGVFYRKMRNQLAYKASVLDYTNTAYSIDHALMHGQGENYGLSLMLSKNTGRLTGWLSYAYTHARRSFDEEKRRKAYPASHERPHELNLLATYALNSHWTFATSMTYASGTPFTAAESLYLLNDNIVLHLGAYNGARLSPYFRCDLSANFKWQGRLLKEHGLCFSVYNLTSRDNELFYFLKTRSDGSFAYRPVTFVLRILPSISYYCKF